jgi:hypothetical protein
MTHRHSRSSTHALAAHLTLLSLAPRVGSLVVIDDTVFVQVDGTSLLHSVGPVSLGLSEPLGEDRLGMGVGLTAEFLLSTRDGGSLVD